MARGRGVGGSTGMKSNFEFEADVSAPYGGEGLLKDPSWNAWP
jgi:hypothetical protein